VERTEFNLHNSCRDCDHFKHYPKYSCKSCACRYTSNYRIRKELTYRYQRRMEKKARMQACDSRLRELYDRINQKCFEKGYLPNAQYVSLQWKPKKGHGGTCWKSLKKIAIGKSYVDAFKSDADNVVRRNLVELLIHEMVHLRLAHHRKTFYTKVKEAVEKVEEKDIPEFFKGLGDKEVL